MSGEFPAQRASNAENVSIWWHHYGITWPRNFFASQESTTICPVFKASLKKHGGPSKAGDCSHPSPKMATVENPTPGEATFYHDAGHGSL